MQKNWKLYILLCADGSLYTGITTDVAARFAQHSAGAGAKYTRGRGPLKLVYVEDCESKSQALKRECQIKTMSRTQKLELIHKEKENT